MLKRSWKMKMLVALTVLSTATAETYAAEVPTGEAIEMSYQDSVNAGTLELTLDDALVLAMGNNPKLTSADAARQAANRRIQQARAGYWPTLGYTYDAARVRTENSTVGTMINNGFDNQLALSWTVYNGGSTQAAVKQAKENYLGQTYGVLQAEQQLKLDTTQAYFGVLQGEKQTEVAEESVARLEEHLKNVSLQYEVGIVAKADVLRSEVEVANARQEFIKARNVRDLAYAQLASLIWIPMDTKLVLKDDLSYIPDDRKIRESIDYAKIHRPEIHKAESSINAAEASVKGARSGYLPTVTVSTGYGRSDEGNNWQGWDDMGWNVRGTVKWNLFDGFYTRGKVGEAMATHTQAEEEYKLTVQSVELEVREAWLNMQEARERIETSAVAVSQAEEDYKIAQARYAAGVGTNLDVLDSQVALTTAQTNNVSALYDYNNSRAALDKAMGLYAERPESATALERKPLPEDILNKKIEQLRKESSLK